jgi:hypothetical protein
MGGVCAGSGPVRDGLTACGNPLHAGSRRCGPFTANVNRSPRRGRLAVVGLSINYVVVTLRHERASL